MGRSATLRQRSGLLINRVFSAWDASRSRRALSSSRFSRSIVDSSAHSWLDDRQVNSDADRKDLADGWVLHEARLDRADAAEPPLCECDDLVDRQCCIGRIFFVMPD